MAGGDPIASLGKRIRAWCPYIDRSLGVPREEEAEGKPRIRGGTPAGGADQGSGRDKSKEVVALREMKDVCIVGLALFIAGGLSFLAITGSDWLDGSTTAQVLNLVAWLVALIGLSSAIVGGLVQALSHRPS